MEADKNDEYRPFYDNDEDNDHNHYHYDKDNDYQLNKERDDRFIISLRREALIGHTSLCLMALLGFVLYTATYSVVYIVKTQSKPVAVLEMWMVLCHLFSSVLTCLIQGVFLTGNHNVLAEAQSAMFLAIALVTTGLGTACLQESLPCTVYYPAAALPPLAASGSMAWAWVMYVASLGCQNISTSSGSGISLGLGKRGAITAASIMALVVPQVISKLGNTCGQTWKSQLCNNNNNACNTGLNITLILFALVLSHAGHFALRMTLLLSVVLHFASVGFLLVALFAIVMVSKSGEIFTWTLGLLIVSHVITIIFHVANNNHSSNTKKGTNGEKRRGNTTTGGKTPNNKITMTKDKFRFFLPSFFTTTPPHFNEIKRQHHIL